MNCNRSRSHNSYFRAERYSEVAGFTLLEVLLAVSIMVIISSVIYASLFGSMDAMDRTRDNADLQEKVRLCFMIMQQDFESAYTSDLTEIPLFSAVNGEHDGHPSDSVTFLGTTHRRMMKDARESDLCEIGYSVMFPEYAGETGKLMRRVDPTVDEDPLSGGVTWELLDGVVGFDCYCYNGMEWLETWDVKGKNAKLPRSVRIHLILRTADGRDNEFTDFIAPVLAQ